MRYPSPPEATVSRLLPLLYTLSSLDRFPQHLSEVVLKAVGGDKCDYTSVDRANGDFRVLVCPEPPALHRLEEARGAVMREHPAMAHFLRTSSWEARAISDFTTAAQYHRLALYGEFFQPLGVEDQLTVPLTPPNAQQAAAVSVDRSSRSFTDDDRRVLAMLQPHIVRAHHNALRYSEALQRGSQGATDGRLARLSDRQHEILSCLAAGLSNAEIAVALGISAGTVRKHVENVLSTLEVHNRTAAAVLFARATPSASGAQWTAELAGFVSPPQPSRTT